MIGQIVKKWQPFFDIQDGDKRPLAFQYLAELRTALLATKTVLPADKTDARQMCLLRCCTTHLESAANRN